MGYRWKELPSGYIVAERIEHPPGTVSIDAYHTHHARVRELQRKTRAAIRRGRVREAVRLVEEIRQVVKARRAARRALRAAQLELVPR